MRNATRPVGKRYSPRSQIKDFEVLQREKSIQVRK